MTLEEIQQRMAAIPGWTLADDSKSISRQWKLADFAEALQFANKIGELAEEVQHHPDLLVSWGKLVATLTTHDAGGLSEKDFELAGKINTIQ